MRLIRGLVPSLLGATLVLAACSGRTVRTENESGSGGSSAGGAGGASGTQGGAGTNNVAGNVGGMPLPPGCGFQPEGPANPATFATPSVVWRRIELFLADGETIQEPQFPPETTASWAGDVAMQTLDLWVAEQGAAYGLVLFFETWMPELENPELWATIASNPAARLSDMLEFSGSAPGSPAFGLATDPGMLREKPTISGRGAWLAEHLFCSHFEQPPDPPPPPPTPAGTSRRQHLEEMLGGNAACQGCHRLIDPLGFSLEHFDENAAYRELDSGVPVDASGMYFTPGGTSLSFTSIFELAPQLAESCDIAECWSRVLLRHALITAGVLSDEAGLGPDKGDVNRVANAFSASGFELRALIRAVVESPAFLAP